MNFILKRQQPELKACNMALSKKIRLFSAFFYLYICLNINKIITSL
jgi:hypothetical protein